MADHVKINQVKLEILLKLLSNTDLKPKFDSGEELYTFLGKELPDSETLGTTGVMSAVCAAGAEAYAKFLRPYIDEFIELVKE